MKQLADIQEEATDEAKTGRGRKGTWVTYDKKGNKVKHEAKSASDIFQLASIPGFALTPRAQKAMKLIAKRRQAKAKAEQDAT